MSSVEIKVPTLGESITEAIIGKFHKKVGDAVAVDEPIAVLETDKVTIDVQAASAGVIEKLIGCYLERRDSEAERFVDLVHRVGIEPFKESVYGNADQRAARRTRERAFA